MHEIKKYSSKKKEILFIIFLLAQRGFTILLPITTEHLVDAVTGQNLKQIKYYGLISLLVTIVFICCMCMANYIATCYEEGKLISMRRDFLDCVNQIPYSSLHKNGSGYYLQRYQSDISRCRPFLLRKKVNFWINGIYMVVIVGMMLRIHIGYAVAMLFPFPVMAFIYYFLANKIEHLTEETESVQDDINSHIEEVLSCSYSLRANNASQWFAEKAEIPFLKKFGMEKKISRIETVYDLALITGILNLLTTAVYFIGGLFAYSGQITVGMIVAMALYYSKLWTPLEFYLDYPKDYAEYKAHKKRLDEVMSLGNMQVDSQKEESLNPMEQITIHNLNYSATNKCIFHNLNLSIKKKEKIAILGENGSGKSTLANILCGLITEYEGEVYYNQLNYVDIKGESIREHICLIPATPQLFSGTIEDNIMLGGKQPIPKQLVEVLEKRGLSLQKQLEENASNISSGEAKLVQLVRGIYRDCDMYIVDEPLNFIDKEYVDTILEVIENLLSEKTLLVISHDDRALRLCQKVYQLKNHALL